MSVDVNPHRFVSLLESNDEKSFEQTQSRFAFSTSFAEESDINLSCTPMPDWPVSSC